MPSTFAGTRTHRQIDLFPKSISHVRLHRGDVKSCNEDLEDEERLAIRELLEGCKDVFILVNVC